MAQDYSAMLAAEKDRDKYAKMKAQLDAAGLKYTEKKQEVEKPKAVKDYSAFEVGAIARGENPNMSSAQFEMLKRSEQAAWESQSPENANSQEALVNRKINSGEWKFISDGKGGGQYIDAFGNNALNVSQGRVTAGTNAPTQNINPQVPQSSIQQLQQQIAEAQKQKNIAALKQAYDKTFGSLQAEKSGLEPMFGAQTRQAVTQSTIAKKSFSDFLAEKGLGASGLSGQSDIAQNVALQSELGSIEARKGQALTDVARRITEAQQVRDYGIAGAESDAAMLNAQQQLERLKQQEQRDYAEQQAGKEEQKQLQQQREQNYAATINPLEDQTAIIQQLKSQGIPDDDYRIIAHQKVRVSKLGQMADQQYKAELARIKNETERQEQAFETAKWKFEQGMPADSVTAALLGIPVGSVIPSQRIKEAQLQLDKIKASKSSGGGSSGSNTTPVVKTSTLKSQVDKSVSDTIEARALEPKESVVKQLRADEIVKYSNNNQITDAQAKELIATYGLTQADIEQAERRFDLVRGMGGR